MKLAMCYITKTGFKMSDGTEVRFDSEFEGIDESYIQEMINADVYGIFILHKKVHSIGVKVDTVDTKVSELTKQLCTEEDVKKIMSLCPHKRESIFSTKNITIISSLVAVLTSVVLFGSHFLDFIKKVVGIK
jgi:hypothetical protein